MHYSTDKLMKLHEKQKNDSLAIFYTVMVIIVSTLIMLALIIKTSEAQEIKIIEKCDDPDKLPENLRKAYENLKSNGYDIKINCYFKEEKPLTDEQRKAIESLR